MSDSDLLMVASTEREAEPFRSRDLPVVVSGVGKVNAAVASTLALSSRSRTIALVSIGLAGSLPGATPPRIGDVVVGEASISAEDGMVTSDGFRTIDEMGFPLVRGVRAGRFPADPSLLARIRRRLPQAAVGGIATVSSCSGTDEAAAEVVRRTGAVAEAMEGVGVLQTALQLGVPAIEIRAISNTTGRRDAQVWDLDAAIDALVGVATALARS